MVCKTAPDPPLYPHPPHPEILCLMEEILNSGSTLRIKVTGKSMSPFVCKNDIAYIKKVPFFSLKPGDLILFKNCEGFLVLHRIIKKRPEKENETVLITKGDALIIYDDTVKENNILGKITGIKKYESQKKSNRA